MEPVTFRELAADESFDPNVISKGTPFTQADFYGKWQKGIGRKVRRFVGEQSNVALAYFQIIRYPLLRGKTYLYMPYGPVTNNTSPEFLSALRAELTRIAKEERAAFVRLDFTPPVSDAALESFFSKAPAYTYHSAYFQPRTEWLLDLSSSEDELLAGMHEKTRYSIRTGEKRGTTSEIITENFGEYFGTFCTLMQETAERNDFGIHDRAYYQQVFDSLPAIPGAYLSIARYEGTVLGICVCTTFGGVTNYVYGCSSSAERGRMPAYLAVWEAIRHAKKLGSVSFNFGGVATESEPHPSWEGLTRFKKRFGGRELHHSAFFDLVTNPLWYRLYCLRKLLKGV